MLLPTVLFAPLPLQKSSQVSSIHQKAWLLRIMALEIFSVDDSLLATRTGLTQLLQGLFSLSDDSHTLILSNRSFSLLAGLLGSILQISPREPWIGESLSSKSRKMLNILDIEPLLAPHALHTGEGAPQIQTTRGDTVIDINQLKDILLDKYAAAVSKYSDSADELKEAARYVLNYAADLNIFSEFSGSLHAFLIGCQGAIIATVFKQFDRIHELSGNSHKMLKYLMHGVLDCSDSLAAILMSPCPRLASCLGIALEVLVIRMRDTIMSLDSTADQVVTDVATNLLAKQLDIIWSARQEDGLGIPMYNVLSMYLDVCQSSCTLASDVKSASVNLLYQKMRCVEPIMNDTMSADPGVATAALSAISALLCYDPTSGVADAVHASPLPSRILLDLSNADLKIFTASNPSNQRIAQLYQAKVDFLLDLCMAGQGSARLASVQKMISLQTISKLTACKVFDIIPETGGIVSLMMKGSGLTRQYLHQFIGPCLRVLLVIVGSLSNSDSVNDQVEEFLQAHLGMTDRILKEAGASSSATGWSAGRMEVEEANLIVQIVCILSSNKQRHINSSLHEGIIDLAAKVFLMNSQSYNPLISALHDYRKADLPGQDAEMAYKA